MVISTYKRIGVDSLWYFGQICGIDILKIKIKAGGPWLTLIDNGNGTFELYKPEKEQHGPGERGEEVYNT